MSAAPLGDLVHVTRMLSIMHPRIYIPSYLRATTYEYSNFYARLTLTAANTEPATLTATCRYTRSRKVQQVSKNGTCFNYII